MGRRLATIAALAAVLAGGCSAHMGNGLQYTPKKASPDLVRQQVLDISVGMEQWASLPQGKSTPVHASISLDANGVKRGYSMVGGFSIYGLPEATLREGYDRIRRALPAAHWKITKDGIDHEVSGSPTVEAEHQTDDHCSLILDLLPARNGNPATLLATLSTPIYVAPEGVDLRRYG